MRHDLVIFSAVVFLAVLAMVSPAVARGNPAAVDGEPSAPRYAIILEKDIPVKLRDGVTVSVDVYRPKAEGRFPVLVEGTAYDKRCTTDIRMSTHTFFVPRGYVVVIWNMRGRFKSGGRFDMERLPGEDGSDVVEWAAAQAWSSGRVGLVGKSYSGQILLHTAAASPPHLVCAMSALTHADAWRWYYRGGAMEFGFALYWGSVILGWDLAEKTLGPGAKLEAWKQLLDLYLADQQSFADTLPASACAPARIAPGVNLLAQWAAHPVDGPYWRRLSPATYFERIRIPILHIGGWYDIFLDGCLAAYKGLSARGGSVLARENQRLFIGPWHHSVASYRQSRVGAADYGDALRDPSFNEVRLAFADYWLKDRRTPLYVEDEPARVFSMGRNIWRTGADWPPLGLQPQRWMLHGGIGGGTISLNDGLLSPDPAVPDAPPQRYLYDPMNPIPTRGGSGLLLFSYWPDGLTDYGQQEQAPVERRSLTFTSAPLERELEIAGMVRAHLSASSSAVDTDWIVRLCDVAPDGTSLNVVEGVQRARFRSSSTTPTLLEPGHIYTYKVEMSATDYVFKAGHCLRLVVSSSSWPRYSRNMNVAEFPEQATEWVIAQNAIHVDEAHPSWLELPVLAGDHSGLDGTAAQAGEPAGRKDRSPDQLPLR